MASGGKFYLLLPNLPWVEEGIRKIENEISEWLYLNLNAEIGLNIETLKLAGNDFRNFDKVFEDINNKLQIKKHKPFTTVLNNNTEWSER